MSRFTRATIIAVTDILDRRTHAEFHRFALGAGLEKVVGTGSVRIRCNAVAQHLIENPNAQNESGENLVYAVVREVVGDAISASRKYRLFDHEAFKQKFGALHSALLRDGFTVEGGDLRRALPVELDIPQADDEVHRLLRELCFTTALGHLDQGIRNHTAGDYAAANAMFRSCFESIIDDCATKLARGVPTPPAHADRRQWLASCSPAFFDETLNEWDHQKRSKGFVEALYRRLCPEGSHPGLSNEDDSTFRLHLVLLNARIFLRRLKRMT